LNMGRLSSSLNAGMQRPSLTQTPSMRQQFTNQGIRPQNIIPRAIMPAPSSSPPAIGPSGLPISPRLGGVETTHQPQPLYMLPLPPVNPVVQNHSRGWMDKLVDYVVGDGASHRYALICRYCATHNGLATPEDFPYTGFRCVFCRQFNPPRQVRPAAQRLPVNTVLIEELDQSSTSTTLKEEGIQSQETSLNSSKESLHVQEEENLNKGNNLEDDECFNSGSNVQDDENLNREDTFTSKSEDCQETNNVSHDETGEVHEQAPEQADPDVSNGINEINDVQLTKELPVPAE